MTDSSVLASTLILRVGVLASQSHQVAQQTTQILIRCKTNKPDENNALSNICQTVCPKPFLILFYCELLHILK